jgi:hypothetical protein
VISELLKCTGSLLVIALTGSVAYLRVFREEDHRWSELVSYSWGAGVVSLYVFGGLLIRLPCFLSLWHWIYLALAIVLLAAAAASGGTVRSLRGLRMPTPTRFWHHSGPWSRLMSAFLTIQAFVIFWININHPIFDSDAANAYRWVGLAKEMYRQGGLTSSTHVWNPLYPSLISLWPNMFSARWRDSFAAVPWFCFYAALLFMSFHFIRRLTGSVGAGLTYCCLLALTPIFWIHVIRPGFSDLIVCYFMTAVCALLFESYYYRDRRFFLFSLIFMLGACMSKQEAVVWMLLIYGVYALLCLYVRFPDHLRRLLVFEAAAILSVFVVYWLTAGFIERAIAGRFTYLGLLFRIRYDPMAFERLAERTFTWATFGVYWYLFFGALAYILLCFRDTFVRVLCLQYLVVGLLLTYYLCFTGNVMFTISGTNSSRLLLQWIPSGGILYAVLASELLRGKTGAGSRAAPHAAGRT